MSRLAVVAAVAILGALLTGCGDDAPSADPGPPRLGGPRSPSAAPPSEPMNVLEEAVQDRLNTRLTDDRLRLEHVDCPRWDHRVPARLRCEGYVEGVVGKVVVELTGRKADRVEFDAELEAGVVATARLVDRLAAAGYHRVDCGPTTAYPARHGLRIVCRVQQNGERSHVVATVSDRTGRVRIEDY